MDVEIRPARPSEYSAAKQLVEEYVASLGVDLGFQRIDEELAGFPAAYEQPSGRLLVALSNGEPIGCVAVRALDAECCELKRLYVRPGARRGGVGRRLAEAALVAAADLGYRRVRLDTLPEMSAARALYRSLGFVEIEPYRLNPVPGTSFMERELS